MDKYEVLTPHCRRGRDLHVSYSWDGDYLNMTEFEPGNVGPSGAFDDTGDPRFAHWLRGYKPDAFGRIRFCNL